MTHLYNLPPLKKYVYLRSESKKFVTCSELEYLSHNVGRIRRELFFTSKDLYRKLDYKKKIYYLLDFSELYTYLWPKNSRSQFKELIFYLLTGSKLTFCLPPGATLELLHTLSRYLNKNQYLKNKLAQILSRPMYEAFLEYYKFNIYDKKMLNQIDIPSIEKIFNALTQLRSQDKVLDRLSNLYRSKVLISLSSIVDVALLNLDNALFEELYSELAVARPSENKDLANRVDAQNYAMVFALNNSFYEKDNLFFLLTTSSEIPYRIFQQRKWDHDPIVNKDPEHINYTSLVRHPIQLLYSSYWNATENISKKYIDNTIKDIEFIHKSWTQISKFKKFRQDRKIPSSSKIRLPQNRKYLYHFSKFIGFYRQILRPVTEILSINQAQEENRRYISRIEKDYDDILFFEDSTNLKKEAAIYQRNIDYRNIMSLFDRIINTTQKEIYRTRNDLKKYDPKIIGDIDSESKIVEIKKLILNKKIIKIEDLEVTEYNAYIKINIGQKQLYFCADKYTDYCCFWWKTNTTIGDFLSSVKMFIRKTVDWKVSKIKIKKNKEFSGLYIYLPNDMIKYNFDDDEGDIYENILSILNTLGRILFVRIAFDFGDFFYDFEPVYPFPQRAGLITHSTKNVAISDFIYNTNSKYIQRDVLRNSIKKIFN